VFAALLITTELYCNFSLTHSVAKVKVWGAVVAVLVTGWIPSQYTISLMLSLPLMAGDVADF